MANSFDIGAVTATVKADVSDFKKGIDDAKKKTNELGDTLKKVGDGVKDFANKATIFTGVLTAGIVLFGKQSVDAFTGAEKEMAVVNTALKNVSDEIANVTSTSKKNSEEVKKSAKLFGELSDETAKVSEAYIQLGFDDENTAKAFSKSLQVTKDVKQSKKDLALASDFARLKDLDLATAVDVLQMAYMGNAKALKSYGINVKDLANKQEIQAVIQEKAGGQAKAFADTYAGKLAILNTEFGNIQETIGEFIVSALVPVVEWFNKLYNSDAVYNAIYKIHGGFKALYDLLVNGDYTKLFGNIFGVQEDSTIVTFILQLHDAFVALGNWINENQAVVLQFLQAIAMVIGTLVIVGTVNALLTALLNPFNLIIMGLTLLFFAWNTNFLGIQNIVMSVVNFIVGLWNTVFMPAITLLTQWITDNWGSIMLITQVLWDTVTALFNIAIAVISFLVKAFLENLQAFWKAHGEQIMTGLRGFWDIVQGIFKTALAIISAVVAVVLGIITGDWDKAWQMILRAVFLGWEGVKNIFNGIINFVKGWGGWLLSELVRPFQDAWNKISELVNKIKDALDFTKRHSPSVVDIVKKGVGLVNNALGDLAINASMNASQIATTVANGGQSLSVASINIDLAGAYIGSEAEATQLAERIGDGIIDKLKQSVRF